MLNENPSSKTLNQTSKVNKGKRKREVESGRGREVDRRGKEGRKGDGVEWWRWKGAREGKEAKVRVRKRGE